MPTDEPDAIEIRLSLSGESVDAGLAARFPAVGLVRAEYPMRLAGEYLTRRSCRERMQTYAERVARTFVNKPVWWRTADLWSNEANTLAGNDLELAEPNPMVGLRGLRRGLHLPETLEIELRALQEVATSAPNLHLMFPFVSDAEEFAAAAEVARRLPWAPPEAPVSPPPMTGHRVSHRIGYPRSWERIRAGDSCLGHRSH